MLGKERRKAGEQEVYGKGHGSSLEPRATGREGLKRKDREVDRTRKTMETKG